MSGGPGTAMNAHVIRFIVLVLAALVAPLAAVAQPTSRVPTIGVLVGQSATTSIATQGRDAFEQGLKELGWAPGRTIRIEYRYAEGEPAGSTRWRVTSCAWLWT